MERKNDQTNTPSSAFYLSRWFAALPLFLFIFLTVALSLRGVFAAEGMVTMGLVGLMIGIFGIGLGILISGRRYIQIDHAINTMIHLRKTFVSQGKGRRVILRIERGLKRNLVSIQKRL